MGIQSFSAFASGRHSNRVVLSTLVAALSKECEMASTTTAGFSKARPSPGEGFGAFKVRRYLWPCVIGGGPIAER
jgi:hypothetical protein